MNLASIVVDLTKPERRGFALIIVKEGETKEQAVLRQTGRRSLENYEYVLIIRESNDATSSASHGAPSNSIVKPRPIQRGAGTPTHEPESSRYTGEYPPTVDVPQPSGPTMQTHLPTPRETDADPLWSAAAWHEYWQQHERQAQPADPGLNSEI